MRSLRRWINSALAVAVLAVVIWRLGTGPFLDGVRAVDGRALVAVAAIELVAIFCYAWRWTIVARGLGIRLSMRAAVPSYYRATFLNLTLPGGVAGDVHRGIRHGRDVRDVGRALRAVVWERAAGQVVQAVLTISVLLVLPSPVRWSMPFVAVGLVVAAVALVLLGRRPPGNVRSRWARLRRTVVEDIRMGVLRRNAWPAVVFASTVVALGNAAIFLIAARAAGVTAPIPRILPLALLALLAVALPNVAGWGFREGATAWVFSAAGLGADRGAATAVAFGVLVLAANLPGAIVLAVGWLPRRQVTRTRARRSVIFGPHGAADA